MNRQPTHAQSSAPAAHYAFGSFTYDAKRGKLQCYGADIPLKPKTATLLHYLLAHPQRVITKSELLDTLWRDEDVVEANLAQHVFLLRQAFATYSPGETFIVTTARQGYCFVAPVQISMHQAPARGTTFTSYAQGRFLVETRTAPSLERAIGAFEATLAQDERHAGAFAGIAQAHVLAAEFSFVEPSDAFRRARAAAHRALELDPENVEAHAVLGHIQLFHDWDFVAAYEALERATWLDPANATGRLYKATFLSIVGNYDAATSEIDSVLAREPFSLTAMTALAGIAMLHEDYATASEMTGAVLSLEPGHGLAQHYRLATLALSGRWDEALAYYHATPVHAYRQQTIALAAYAAACAGQTREAQTLIAELDDRSRWVYASNFNRALAFVGLGEFERARALLADGIGGRDPWSIYVLRYPAFAHLPGIDELRHRIGPHERTDQ